MLELVVLEVGETEPKHALGNVEVVANAAPHGIRGDRAYAVDLVLGVQRRQVDADLVALGGARGVHAEVERRGIGITARQAETRLDEAGPEIGQAGVSEAVDARLTRLLLLLRSDGVHVRFAR